MAKDLTAKSIENLKPGSSRREIPDGHTRGLFFVLQPSGAASWAFRYRFGGKSAKLTLGPSPALSLRDARELAADAIKAIARGEDPAGKKREAKAAAAAAVRSESNRVERVLEDFLAAHVARNLKASTQYEVGRLLKKELEPWRGRMIEEIEAVDVHRLLDGVVARGAAISANRLHAALRRMFRWAKERRIIAVSPMDDIRPPISERGRARERVLDDHDLALVWRAAGRLEYPFGPMIQLLVLTGQRRNEVAGMRWSEVDFDKATWTIPSERSKNHLAHTVPLPPAAVAILKELPRIGKEGFAFTVTGESSVSGFSRAKARLDKAMLQMQREEDEEAEAIASWTLHDLRRSLASGLARLGVQLPVIERILNHVSGSFAGVVGVYQRHSFADEMRGALDRWAAHLDRVVAGEAESSNVVELRREA